MEKIACPYCNVLICVGFYEGKEQHLEVWGEIKNEEGSVITKGWLTPHSCKNL